MQRPEHAVGRRYSALGSRWIILLNHATISIKTDFGNTAAKMTEMALLAAPEAYFNAIGHRLGHRDVRDRLIEQRFCLLE